MRLCYSYDAEYQLSNYTNAKEFKVETNFSLIVPVLIQVHQLTHRFTNDTPEIIETGETRYTPNFGVNRFYSHGNQQLPNPFGFKVLVIQVSY
jgi:hypothetical protein